MDMSHATSTVMDMAMGTATAGASASTSSAAAASMSMGGGCKISMLWNWTVIDSCFIARSWRITSKGMFAGSCIGVVLLVMTLELLRRSSQEYDRYLIRQHRALSQSAPTISSTTNNGDKKSSSDGEGSHTQIHAHSPTSGTPFRPSIVQQAVRATLHMVQFTIAYFVMLLAMYYNGYIIISIIIGAWLGAFVFSWQTLDMGGPKEDASYCCG